jgi:hypothetical protein
MLEYDEQHLRALKFYQSPIGHEDFQTRSRNPIPLPLVTALLSGSVHGNCFRAAPKGSGAFELFNHKALYPNSR